MNDSVQTRRERDITVLAAVAHFMAHFYMLVFPSLVLVLGRAFDMPLDRTLALSWWMYLLYGLGALPAGVLTDLGRPKVMLVICLAGMGIGSVAAGLSRGPGQLSLALALLGLSASIYHPAGMALISRGVRRRGRALGINGLWGNLGVVAAPLATGVLAVTCGWRWTYLILAAPSLAGALLALRLRVDGAVDAGVSVGRADSRQRRALYFGLLCGAMALGGIAYRGQTIVLPSYFAEQITFLERVLAGLDGLPVLGRSTLAATALTSVAYLTGAVGQVVGGRLADRYDLRLLYLFFHAAGAALLWSLGYLMEVPLLVCALAYAFFGFGMQPVENSLVAALTPPRLRSTGYGLKFILTFGVGALAVPLVGRWQQNGGLSVVFPRLALCLVFLLVFAALLWLVSRRRDLREGVRN